MAESIRLVNSIYSVQDCQDAESEEVCVFGGQERMRVGAYMYM